LIALLATVSGCTDTPQKSQFTGTIVFSVEKDYAHEWDYEFMDWDRGDGMVFTYLENGDFFKRYLNVLDYGFDFTFTDISENISYAKYNWSDTLYYFPLDDASSHYNFTRSDSAMTILGHTCSVIEAEGFSSKMIDSPPHRFKYYYSDSFYLNPTTYEDYYEDDMNKVYETAQAPYLRYELFNGEVNMIYHAIAIYPDSLPNNHFTVDDYPTLRIY